jgi:biotin carboxylase
MNILVLGGSSNQLELILAIKKRKFKIVLVDPNENPVGKKYSDVHIREDYRNTLKIIEYVQPYGIEACLTDQSDMALLSQNIISKELNLKHNQYSSVLNYIEKDRQLNIVNKANPKNIPTSKFFYNSSDLIEHIQVLGDKFKEFIIKPQNGQGSKGVFLINKNNYLQKIKEAFYESNRQGIILQEYIIGDEYSVEAFVYSKKINVLAITRKEHYKSNECLDKKNFYLNDIPLKIEESLKAKHIEIIDALGPLDGMTHAEYMVTKNGDIKLIEIAARGGGGNISGKIIPYLTDFSPVDFLIDIAIGLKPKIKFSDYKKKFVIMHFYDLNAKIKKSFTPSSYTFLLHYEFDNKKYDSLNRINDSRSRPGYFIVTGNTGKKVIQNESLILKDSLKI